MVPVQQKIQDITTSVENYDYDQFARFLTQMQGTGITPELAESLYSRIMRPRIQRVSQTAIQLGRGKEHYGK